jgi:type IV secretion system protein VirB3
MIDDEDIDVQPLYKGLARPPMILGVTDTYAVLGMVVCVTIYVGLKSIMGALGVGIVLWAFGYLACLRDPRIFHIWGIKLRYFWRCRRSAHWGGNSYDPW